MSIVGATNRGVLVETPSFLRFGSLPTVLRVALLLGCMASVALAAWVGAPQLHIEADAELARLLRGMAIVKGTLVLAGVGLLLWRFGHPVSGGAAAVYLGGAWLVAGASMLIWQLTFIPLAAAVFHLGELALLLTAWRDGKALSRRSAA